MKRKRGGVGKGNHVPALLLCSHRLRMRREHRPLLPAPCHVPLLPRPRLRWQEVTGTRGHSCSCPRRVRPCSSACCSGCWQLRGYKTQTVKAMEGKATELSSVPAAAPHKDPKGSLPSAPSIHPLHSEHPHRLAATRFGTSLAPAWMHRVLPWSCACSSGSDAGFRRWAGAPLVLVVN